MKTASVRMTIAKKSRKARRKEKVDLTSAKIVRKSKLRSRPLQLRMIEATFLNASMLSTSYLSKVRKSLRRQMS